MGQAGHGGGGSAESRAGRGGASPALAWGGGGGAQSRAGRGGAGHGGGVARRAGWGGEGPHQHLHIPSPGTVSSPSQSPRRASLQWPGGGGRGVRREETPQPPPALGNGTCADHDTPYSRTVNGSLLMARFVQTP